MVGHLRAPEQAKLTSLDPIMREKAGLPVESGDAPKLDILGEVKHGVCECLDPESTLSTRHLEDGDILIFAEHRNVLCDQVSLWKLPMPCMLQTCNLFW